MTATTNKTKLFNLTHEIKNREGHNIPIDNFLTMIQAQLEEWISSDPETFDEKFVPMPIHLKIQGPPRINKRDFSGTIIIGRINEHMEIIEMRLQAKNCIYCWRAHLTMPNPEIAKIIYKIARKNAFEFIAYKQNELKIDTLNRTKTKYSRQQEITKMQKQIIEGTKTMNQLCLASNMYKFCHILTTMPDGNERTTFSIEEIYSSMEKTLEKKISHRILTMMLCTMIESGVFDPLPGTDYNAPIFKGAIPLYEVNEDYDNYLKEQEKNKLEQKRATLNLSLTQAQKEVARINTQLEQAKEKVERIKKEIEQFDSTN